MKSNCPKCGTENRSHRQWTAKSPRSKAVLTTFLFVCKKCKKKYRDYKVKE